MKVSKVAVALSAEDILSIINDFIKVNGLTISEINIDKQMEVKGSFKKILSLGFKITTDFISTTDNKVKIRLLSASLMSIGILKPFRKLALKIGLKGFKEQGILVSGDEIIIDINTMLKKFPFVHFKLEEARIDGNKISIEVDSIDVSLSQIKNLSEVKKPVVEAQVQENIEEQPVEDDYIMNIEVNKVEDSYTHSREYVVEHIPEQVKPYKDYIMFIPDIAALLFRLFKDKRVPTKTKVVLGTCLGYISLPFDIIPDKIPFIGSLDDITVFFFALNRVINDIPIEIILANWQGKNELVVVLRNLVEFLTGFTGAKNLDTVYEVIDYLVIE